VAIVVAIVAVLVVASLALALAMVGSAVRVPSTLDLPDTGGLGRRREGGQADGDRQQEEELREGVAHGFDAHFFTIAPASQSIRSSGSSI
jgi:hypothetical protein